MQIIRWVTMPFLEYVLKSPSITNQGYDIVL